MPSAFALAKNLGTSAFAFRGYDLTNLGRTPELLIHRAYGPIVEKMLREASELASDYLRRHVDLVLRARERRDSTSLDSYGEDVTLIIAMEAAQIRLMEEFLDAPFNKARLTFGYSLGEIGALVAAKVYPMQELLRVLLVLADDAVSLAEDVHLGVLFSRGKLLDIPAVKRLCLEVSQQSKGVIDTSAFLSPNSLLLLGQGSSLDTFKSRMPEALGDSVVLRKKPHRWPPMHTPITWQRAIPNRAAVLLATAPGGFHEPSLPLLSGVTGKASYNDHNSRELLHHWTDHPQRLWNMVYETLATGVDTVVHVGPAPNIIPATFKRLAEDVRGQLAGYSPGRLGLRAVSHIVRRPWLAQLLPSSTALLRAPFLRQVNLEDLLLEKM